MRIVIANLTTKEITTVRGPAEVIHFRDAATNVWYDSFAGAWNVEWHDGTEIEVAPDQIKHRVKGDREYLTITAPTKAPGPRPPASDTGPRIISLLERIASELGQIKALLASPREEPTPEPYLTPREDDADPGAGF
jgi:hypothetical protein